jgi:hypothetical protein
MCLQCLQLRPVTANASNLMTCDLCSWKGPVSLHVSSYTMSLCLPCNPKGNELFSPQTCPLDSFCFFFLACGHAREYQIKLYI